MGIGNLNTALILLFWEPGILALGVHDKQAQKVGKIACEKEKLYKILMYL